MSPRRAAAAVLGCTLALSWATLALAQQPGGWAPPPQGYAPPQGYPPPEQGYPPPEQGYPPPPEQGYPPPPAAGDGYAPEPAADEAAEPAATGRPIEASLGAGFGAGMSGGTLPEVDRAHTLPGAGFAAFDLAFDLEGVEPEGLAPALQARYRSSLGLDLETELVGGTREASPARKHELSVDLAGKLSFGDPKRDLALLFGLGWGTTDLRTDAEITVPPYTLNGPRLAFALRVPFSEGAVVLDVGADVRWIARVSDALLRRGAASTGLGFGARAELRVALVGPLELQLRAREQHASVSGLGRAPAMSDFERFFTLGLGVAYR